MAGDWIKIEATTPDKPEVYAIAERLGIQPEHAFGCLGVLWIWADQQTFDGNASGVTKLLVDRKTGVTGFADAMVEVGWLEPTEKGLAFTNFDRHNGNTAKKRAVTAKRVAKYRATSEENCNADSVTPALAKEEKEKEIKPIGRNSPSRFAEFYSIYPKKAAKVACEKKWKAKRLDDKVDMIIADVKRRMAEHRPWVDGFPPNPLTYLNQERWNDDIEPVATPPESGNRDNDYNYWRMIGAKHGIHPGPTESPRDYIARVKNKTGGAS